MNSVDQPIIKYRKDYQPSQYLITKTELSFQLYHDHVIVDSTLNIKRNSLDKRAQLEPLTLDGVELDLLQIKINHQTLEKKDYKINNEHLVISNVSEQFVLFTQVKIFPQKNTSLEGLYRSSGKFCTQCEAEGFRKITYYLDRPEIMSEFFVSIEADKTEYPLLLSNGNPISNTSISQSNKNISNNRHRAEWHDPFPKPSYLFALVAGDLDCLEDQFVTMSERKVKLQLFVDKGKLNQCQFAMTSLIASMKWDEDNFGREYDLDLYMIVAVSDFNMGAMENKGLNIFNTAYVLANEKTATDSDFKGVECVIGHEYFHNWTGNRITCRDWFQLSLKEGLTVFRDQKFSEFMQSEAVERIEQVKVIRSAQFSEDSGPMAHPIRPDSYIEMNNFYTVTVYNKGAEVIRMMYTLLGKDGFRKGMDLYFDRHDGQAVTCEDYILAMEDANNVDWKLFRNWYKQAGTPELKVSITPNAHSKNKLTLECSQVCLDTPDQQNKHPFMIPIKIGFITDEGECVKTKDLSIKNSHFSEDILLTMTEASQTFELELSHDVTQSIPSLLRGFSAPVKLNFNYTSQQLACLFANDPNSFNRWDAGQTLMRRLLLSVEDKISNKELHIISDAINNVLNNQSLDDSLKSLAMQIPNLNGLIGEVDKINLDSLFLKYKQLKEHIASQLEKQWLNCYNVINNNKLQTASNRQLKNTALSYLITADNKYIDIAIAQQINAGNMTDEISALQIICNTDHVKKSQQIELFYKKWNKEELVLDKWFSVQVLNNNESVISEVKKLLQHEFFSMTNPNRVRSVIGTFIANNTQQFHSSTGEGYQLLFDLIIQLNSINPQIGARLTKHFSNWKKFDAKRQALIKDHLEKIISTENLSNDIFEIVNKSLQV